MTNLYKSIATRRNYYKECMNYLPFIPIHSLSSQEHTTFDDTDNKTDKGALWHERKTTTSTSFFVNQVLYVNTRYTELLY